MAPRGSNAAENNAPLALGIIGQGLVNWGGGIDYMRLVLGALATRKDRLRIELLMPALPPREPVLTRTLAAFRAGHGKPLLDQLRGAYWEAQSRSAPEVERSELLAMLTRSAGPIAVQTYRDDAGLRALVKARRLDAVLPSVQDLGPNFPVPWVGYLPDVQHRRLPEMFAVEEIQQRDRSFASILAHADAMALTSSAVCADVRTFYASTAPLISQPFATLPPAETGDVEPRGATALRYGVRGRYFIVCNQFWKHKAHDVAVHALRLLRESEACRDIELVCTGATTDYRNPGWFSELTEQISQAGLTDAVRICGRIPKQDQMLLVRDAVALVQPSLFEGTQGGLAVADAVSLGVRAIVSDIAVNTEISEPLVTFFESGSAASLTAQMHRALDEPSPPPDVESLEAAARVRLFAFADGLIDAARTAIDARQGKAGGT